jgi:hypothetical protein
MRTIVDDISEELYEYAIERLKELLENEPAASVIKKHKLNMTVDILFCYDCNYLKYEIERERNTIRDISDEELKDVIFDTVVNGRMLGSDCNAKTAAVMFSRKNCEYARCEKITAYFSMDSLYRTCLENINKPKDAIVNYCKLIIRHELGHVTDYILHNDMLVEDAHKLDMDSLEIEKKVLKKMNEYWEREDIPEEDRNRAANMIYYNEIPLEKRANEFAKFTPEELEVLYRGEP